MSNYNSPKQVLGDMGATSSMTDSDELRDNDRIYQNLMHLHKQEHLKDGCFCTTEIAGAYRNILDEFNEHTTRARIDELQKLLSSHTHLETLKDPTLIYVKNRIDNLTPNVEKTEP